MLAGFNPHQIQDLEGARQAIIRLLNLVEDLKGENDALRETVQNLRDEINRLKGEQGKPDIKPGKKPPRQDHSSEKERRRPRKWRKESKLAKIKVDREQILTCDPSQLPLDAEFKGHEPVVVQDIRISSDTVRFLKEKFYSPSQRKTYLAPLPTGYSGQFGPGLRAWVITLYFASGMTEPKIIDLLSNFGVSISKGQLSNLLIKKQQVWHTEKDELYRAGLASGSWQHIDDTATRVDGDNHHCHIVCNPWYTAYFTCPHKNRLTVLEILQNISRDAHPVFLFNDETTTWLKAFAVPQWARRVIASWEHEKLLTYAQVDEWVNTHLTQLSAQQRARVFEAAAISVYHQQTQMPIVPLLVSDDAPQFRCVTAEQALCWVHEGRHYKKLTPFLEYHRQLLDDFRARFWQFYRKLQDYRARPSPETGNRFAAGVRHPV